MTLYMFCSTLGRRLTQHLHERPAGLVSLFRIFPRQYNRPATVTQSSSRLVPVRSRQIRNTRRVLLPVAGLSLGLLHCSNDSNQWKLFRAIQRGNVAEVERLIESKCVNVRGRHELGWTALHLAAVKGRQEIVSLLLTAGADVNAEEEFMNVYTTAREKRLHSLEVQITREDEFSDKLSPRANFRGCTPLHYAALADNIGTINTRMGAIRLFANQIARNLLFCSHPDP